MDPHDADSALLTSRPLKGSGHLPRTIALSLAIHVVLALLVGVIVYTSAARTLRELLANGGARQETGPADVRPITMHMESPPTEQEPVPIPTPVPLDIPTPTREPTAIQPDAMPLLSPPSLPPPQLLHLAHTEPPKPRPRYTAPGAHGEGKTQTLSRAISGTSGLPHPGYPLAALKARLGGTVQMQVAFDSRGEASTADVVASSGVHLLDDATRDFILAHWKNTTYANQTIRVPIIYNPALIPAGAP